MEPLSTIKGDINSRSDIETLVDSFYRKVIKDDVIGHFFTQVVVLDWEKHIPLMYDFWETTLFHKALYKSNPVKVHLDLHKKAALEKVHFERWVELFHLTVEEHFEGRIAEMAKQRASSIATVLQIKILAQNG